MSSTTTSAAVATTSGVPQVWIFPPGGEDIPPVRSTGNIGPLHLYDIMVFQWTPNTTPEIIWACFSEGGNQTTAIIIEGQTQPISYQFNEPALAGAADIVFCHVYFGDSIHGNTVTWQYMNSRRASGPVTYTAPAAIATSATLSASGVVSTDTLISSIGTSTTGTAPNTEQSQAATSTAASSSSGLSTGASAGIGVGVALGVLLLVALLGFLLLRRRKARKAHVTQQAAWMDNKNVRPAAEPAPAYNSDYGHGAENIVYAKHAEPSGPNQAAELASQHAHELPGQDEPRELPAGR